MAKRKASQSPKRKRGVAVGQRGKAKPTSADAERSLLDYNAEQLLKMAGEDRPWTPPEGMTFHRITHPKKRAMLSAYTVRGTVARAAEDARVTRRTHYNWLEADADYAEAFAEARQIACDVLESEARRRAVDGVREPVYWQGQLVGYKRAHSDTLLIFLMKGGDPEKWQDRSRVTHDGQMFLGFPDLTPDEIAGGRDVAAAARSRLAKRRRKTHPKPRARARGSKSKRKG